MNLLGNIIWLIFGGFIIAIEYIISSFYCALPSLVYHLAYKPLSWPV